MDRLAGPLAALVVAAGCTVNPFYASPTTSAGSTTTGEGSSSSSGTSWASATDVSSGSTSSGVTSEPSTTSGLIPDMGVPETSGSTSGGGECLNEKTLILQGSNQIEDAFFTNNPFDEVCDLEVSEPNWPCGILNLGAVEGMTMARVDMGPEVLFALQPTSDLGELIESLELQGNQILGAQIVVTIFGLSEDVTFEVGVIGAADVWVAGAGYGNQVYDGEATFDRRVNSNAPENWTNVDGPRGASTPLCQMSITAGDYVDYTPWVVCDLDPAKLGKLALGHGVVIFFPDDGLPHYGPIFKATEAPQELAPSIEIRYCPP